MADLIRLEEYKSYKNINSDSDDETLISLIPAISDMVKNYCGRTFIDYSTTAKTEYWSEGGDTIFLSEFPVATVTSVNTSTDNHTTQEALTENEDYYLNSDEGLIISAGGNFLEQFNYVQIVYTAGYIQDKLPGDLKLAVFSLMDYYRKEQFTQRKSLGAHTVEQLESDELPGHIKRTLDSYKSNIL